ncbi:MAG: formate dehydrogenase accessory sulfurtransferase FdhD [Pseudomonadota bacterium]
MQDSFSYNVFEFSDGHFNETSITAIQEIPLTIYLNEQVVVTLLCTGKDPVALVVGFLKADGLLTDRKELKDVRIEQKSDRIVARVFSTYGLSSQMVQRTITSGCGKGTGFDRVTKEIKHLTITSGLKVGPDDLFQLMEELNKRSTLYRATGGCHNAALAGPDRLLIFYEDLGRHNAIDMIQGKCFLDDINTNDKLIVTTGRISSEILIKAIRLGVPVLASRSAATRFAIDLAREVNMTLVGYVRGQRMVVYNHAGRIKGVS